MGGYIQKAAGVINRSLISIFGLQVTYAHSQQLKKGWFDKFLYFQRLFDLLGGVEGDVVECGVASGNSLCMLASLVRSSGKSRHIWGFDSWLGLPEPSKEDLATPNSRAIKGKFKDESMKKVLTNLRWYGFCTTEIEKAITLTKGHFNATLPRYNGPHIALLHIDADLYYSYKDVFRYLWRYVSIGGLVAFDEYHRPDMWAGAKQAVDECLSQLTPGSATLYRDTLFGRYYVIKTLRLQG